MDALFQTGLSNAAAAAVLAVIVAVVTRFWRNPFAAHTLWLLVLLKLVTPPFWNVPLPSGAFEESTRAVERPSDRQKAAERADPASRTGREQPEVANPPVPVSSSQAGPRPAAPELRGDPPTRNIPDPVSVGAELAETTARDQHKGLATAAPTSGVQTSPDVRLWPIQELVIAGWLLGSGVLFAALILRTVSFGRSVRRISRHDEGIQRLAGEVGARIGLRRCPPVRIVPAAIGPAVWCPAFRPVLLVPEYLAAADREQLETVLSHELVHLRRQDHRVRQLEALVLLLYWWHPAVWWAVAGLRQVEEECCDSEVLATHPESAHRYAEVLLSTMELLHNSRSAGAAFSSGFGHGNQMKRRIEMILTQPADRRLKWASRAVLVLAALALPLVPGFAESEPKGKTSPAGYPEHKDASAEEATDDATEGAVSALDHRRDRPYGELGFPDGQFGPHWEFVRLATHAPVRCELNVSAKQDRELQFVYRSLMEKDGRWSRGDIERDLLREEFDRAMEVLRDEQERRIQEIILQRRGVTAFLDEDIRQKLDLADQQVERIRAVWDAHVARSREGWKGDEGRESLHGVWKTALAVLNDSQRAKFAEMVGPPVRPSACDPLTVDQLLALNRRAGELRQFRDNVFLFEEKVAEFNEDAEQEFAGRSICLTGKVERVTREHVVMQIVNAEPALSERFPSIVLLNAGADEPLESPNMTQRMFADLDHQIGRNMLWSAEAISGTVIDPRSTLTLDVETLVPLQQAKRLRAGENVQVCATLRDVVLFTGGDDTQLGFIFADPELSTPAEDTGASEAPAAVANDAATPPTGTQVKIFTLQNARADGLAKVLGELFDGSAGKPVRITSDKRTNSLIVAASEQDLAIIAAIIIRLDEPPTDVDSDANSDRKLEKGSPPPGAAAPATQSNYLELLRSLMPLKGVELRYLDKSNGVVATGSREDVERVTELMRLLERLATPPTEESTTTAQIKVFVLESVDATELAKALNAPPFELQNKGLHVKADRKENRLIAAGSAESQDLLQALLKQLDQPPEK